MLIISLAVSCSHGTHNRGVSSMIFTLPAPRKNSRAALYSEAPLAMPDSETSHAVKPLVQSQEP